MPVTAITIFLPTVEAQNPERLQLCSFDFFPMAQEVPQLNPTQLSIIGARSKHRQGLGARDGLARFGASNDSSQKFQ
jgi:hypothetical protein